MTLENSQQVLDDLTAVFGDPDYGETDGDEIQTSEPESKTRWSLPYRLVLTFVGGVLLGWFLIGWWAWPVRWINAEPYDLSPKYQKMYVGLVAAEYWQTRSVSRVHAALRDWDEQALADLLARMHAEASSPEEVQRLAALAEALTLPDAQASMWNILSEQTTILLGFGVSIMLIVGAMGAVLVPRLVASVQRPARQQRNIQKRFENRPMADDDTDTLFNDESETTGQSDNGQTNGQSEGQPAEDMQPQTEQQTEKIQAKNTQPDEIQLVETTSEEEEEGEEEEEPPEIVKPEEVEDDPYLLDEEEEEEDADKQQGESIFSFLEEDDEAYNAEIAALAEGLPEVAMDILLQMAENTMDKFRNGARQPA